jgi:hypothetical protein
VEPADVGISPCIELRLELPRTHSTINVISFLVVPSSLEGDNRRLLSLLHHILDPRRRRPIIHIVSNTHGLDRQRGVCAVIGLGGQTRISQPHIVKFPSLRLRLGRLENS